jgi:cytochrome c553
MPNRIKWTMACLLAVAASQSYADADAGKAKAEQICTSCHGAKGNPVLPTVPILSAQTARYIYLELQDFKAGRRIDPVMTPLASTLTKEEMLDVAEYFASQVPVDAPFKTDRARVLKGAAKADETLCTMCHLGGLKGQNEIPRLAGQQAEYVMKQLHAFKDRTRTNDAGNMTSVAQTLSDDDIVNLTHYIADLQ